MGVGEVKVILAQYIPGERLCNQFWHALSKKGFWHWSYELFAAFNISQVDFVKHIEQLLRSGYKLSIHPFATDTGSRKSMKRT